MTTETKLTFDEIETIDRTWTDQFAKRAGWNEHEMEDPIDDLEIFFQALSGTLILDSGCGWGRFVWRFHDQNLEYVGLDQSIEMLNVARENNPESIFIESSFRKIPYPSEYFDGVWICCALSGVPKNNIVEVLAEHKRILKQGGVIMIVMPMLNESSEQLFTDSVQPPLYQSYYFMNEFMGCVTEAGFDIVSYGRRPGPGSFSILARKKS